jgi:hypothetical protein
MQGQITPLVPTTQKRREEPLDFLTEKEAEPRRTASLTCSDMRGSGPAFLWASASRRDSTNHESTHAIIDPVHSPAHQVEQMVSDHS